MGVCYINATVGFFSKHSPSELNSGSTEDKMTTYCYQNEMSPSLILRVAPFSAELVLKKWLQISFGNLKSGCTSHILTNYNIFHVIFLYSNWNILFCSIQTYCAITHSLISKYATFCGSFKVSHKISLSKFQNTLCKVLAVLEENMYLVISETPRPYSFRNYLVYRIFYIFFQNCLQQSKRTGSKSTEHKQQRQKNCIQKLKDSKGISKMGR